MKKYRRIVLLILTLCLLSPDISFAMDGIDVSVPIRVNLEGNSQKNHFNFTIERIDGSGEYLPEDTRISIEQNTLAYFGFIKYDTPGIYHYHIKQIIDSDETIVYDDTIYELVVYIEREKDASGNYTGNLAHSMILLNGDSDGKFEEIVFNNKSTIESETDEESTIETEEEELETIEINTKDENIKTENPKTGDDFKLIHFIATILISIIIFVSIERKYKLND